MVLTVHTQHSMVDLDSEDKELMVFKDTYSEFSSLYTIDPLDIVISDGVIAVDNPY